jgi:UDP-N-acetylmuramate: L-alanyl-gamma-D-glutamyl-meso-diaminopimelate ligase
MKMRIHILGICGTFMGGLARLALELGHRVTGADANTYPPMSTQLEAMGIAAEDGYRVTPNLTAADLILIGNALSRGNPAVEHILNERLPHASGPEWLAAEVLRGRDVVAVAGTHGKTTTASLIAWLLQHAGLNPGFLIGGVPQNFGVSARLGSGSAFVIEADEYDTAFFDKRPKFIHYRPKVLVLNNLEFDHADIFDNLEAIERQFHYLVRTVPGNGCILYQRGDAALARALAHGCWTRRESFGDDPQADWCVAPLAPDWSRLQVRRCDAQSADVQSPLYGRHNALNTLAAVAAAHAAGAPLAACADGVRSFRNAKRRLERIVALDGIAVYDDFAHHPSAIRETLRALRSRVGTERIVAVLEPRSNTMRRGVLAADLAGALADADFTVLYQPPDLSWDLAAATGSLADRRVVRASIDEVLETLSAELRPGDHVILMSNGGFGGLQARLAGLLSDKRLLRHRA